MTDDGARLLTATEAGERLGVSRQTIRRLAKSRGLPAVSIGREMRYPAAGLAAWVAAQVAQGPDPHPDQAHDPGPVAQVQAGRAYIAQVCRLCGLVLDDGRAGK